MSDKTNPPAFPRSSLNGLAANEHEGMTLRDYFAAKAMQSLLVIGANRIREERRTDGSTFQYPDQPWYFGGGDGSVEAGEWGEHYLAFDAYELADAMLKARK
jgi:hypothetical protein